MFRNGTRSRWPLLVTLLFIDDRDHINPWKRSGLFTKKFHTAERRMGTENQHKENWIRIIGMEEEKDTN